MISIGWHEEKILICQEIISAGDNISIESRILTFEIVAIQLKNDIAIAIQL